MPYEEDAAASLQFTLDKHQHYSPEVQALVREFQVLRAGFLLGGMASPSNALYRSFGLQAAWNKLAKLRRQETGVAYYLTPVQYDEACK